jgi:hypothetical protein
MYLICELFTEEPEGGSNMIPFKTFKELYTYLAQMNCSSSKDEEDTMKEQDSSDGRVTNTQFL